MVYPFLTQIFVIVNYLVSVHLVESELECSLARLTNSLKSAVPFSNGMSIFGDEHNAARGHYSQTLFNFCR